MVSLQVHGYAPRMRKTFDAAVLIGFLAGLAFGLDIGFSVRESND